MTSAEISPALAHEPPAAEGSASVEFVIAALAAFTLIIAVVQIAVTEYARHVAQYVAASALAAARADGANAADGHHAAADVLGRLGGALDNPAVHVERGPHQVEVIVTGTVGLLWPLHVTVHERGPVENFTTDSGGR